MAKVQYRYANGNARRKLRARLRRVVSVCPHCGVELDWEHPYLPNSAELDEVYPVSKLPEQLKRRACLDPANVQVLCRACNKKKGNKVGYEPRREGREHAPVYTSEEW